MKFLILLLLILCIGCKDTRQGSSPWLIIQHKVNGHFVETIVTPNLVDSIEQRSGKVIVHLKPWSVGEAGEDIITTMTFQEITERLEQAKANTAKGR